MPAVLLRNWCDSSSWQCLFSDMRGTRAGFPKSALFCLLEDFRRIRHTSETKVYVRAVTSLHYHQWLMWGNLLAYSLNIFGDVSMVVGYTVKIPVAKKQTVN